GLAAMRADRRAQRLRGVEADRVEAGVILLARAAGAGFEADARDAERARDQPLFDADILDAVERDGAVLARQHAAFDDDLIVADEETKAHPAEPGRAEREEQEGAERGDDPHPFAGK